MRKALVTGGAGFIGSHVVEAFLRAGFAVTVVDDLSSGFRENVPKDVTLHVIDVASGDMTRLVRYGGFAAVAHLAAQTDVRKSVADPKHDAAINVIGTLNILEAVRSLAPGKRPRIVFASTGGALYGDTTQRPTPESAPTNPDAPYGNAKLAAEYYLAYYGRVWGLEAVALRFGNVYGPRQNPDGEAGVIAIFSGRIVKKEPLIVYGTGDQTRDYVYVGDVADAFLAAATQPIPDAGDLTARAFNIGTGVETSVSELVTMLGEVTSKVPLIRNEAERAGEVSRSVLDARKAREHFGWRPKADLRRGLELTLGWIESRKAPAGR
jgi:UDP-glucose 4-epimerase